MRIVSLIPSGTDLVAALGLEQYLVGVSHECDHACAAGLPILTSGLIPSNLTPFEIDSTVSQAVASGEGNAALYRTDRALLRDLQPDLILTQTICDVCAVNADSIRHHLPPGAQLYDLGATDLAGLWADLRAIAALARRHGMPCDAEPVIAALQSRLEAVERAVAERPRPRVLALEWTDPPFLGGHWVPEIIERAGGTHILGEAGQLSRRSTWAEIGAAHPEVMLMLPCGYTLPQVVEQIDILRTDAAYQQVCATFEDHIWATDATRLFSRCTPASIRAVEVVAGILHPEVWPLPSPEEALPILPAFAANKTNGPELP
jgi:iron complex transport system substrate-binding protein